MQGLYIRTYGCQMNAYDSERMADVLAPLGYAPVDTPEAAALIILNTCHIREKASEKLFSDLGRLKELKQDGTRLLAVAGCVAQAEGEEITRRAPYVDMVLGPQSYHRLPEMVMLAKRQLGTVVDLAFTPMEKFDQLPVTESSGITAFLSIQEGCDKFCSFCVVPYTRGAEFSRPLDAILAEARARLAAGARELTLLGQNVNAWHGEEGWNLGRLLKELAKLEGLERLRYTTSHPRDMHEELYEVHATEPKVMPYLHLPVQSGSDRILKAMNRKHTAEEYRRMIERLRAGRADIALSSDFIVGFPGETEQDFEDTLALVRGVTFASAYSFVYSPRPGTPAASAEQLPEEVKNARLQRLQALLEEQRTVFNQRMLGQQVTVLFDQPGRHPGQMMGKTPWMQSVHVNGPATLIGQQAEVRITEIFPHSLRGELAEVARRAA